jgi:dolichol kinase
MKEVIPTLMLAGCFLALFGVAELLYHFGKVRAEWTRKIVHFGTGLLTLLFPVVLVSHWQVLFLCASFLVILLASLKFGWLPSINAIDRFSYGSILFPVIVYLLFLVFQIAGKGLIVFYLPILVLAICDPLAAVVGKRFPFGKYRIMGGGKSAAGSLAFFVSALLVTVSTVFAFNDVRSGMLLIALVPCVATVAEALGVKGMDNFTIPASVVSTLCLIG